eukprot:CAMPEP_0116899050 /NCGR_PEP_ID=MMETSP0467-20121206/7691_1 /TAXON_ID=283647 /ORGANISM="Mesodinium pulex, Strain SPMC105" /LENGTH=95 /DNA_ID=CAMNT_0004571627 /DNA_START=810 /DNA_END=1097 /DNA_ORIENTATION=+
MVLLILLITNNLLVYLYVKLMILDVPTHHIEEHYNNFMNQLGADRKGLAIIIRNKLKQTLAGKGNGDTNRNQNGQNKRQGDLEEIHTGYDFEQLR